jgi:hypothetical protein
MPLLVRLTDSEIKAVDGVVAQALDAVENCRGVLEEVGSAGLAIHQEPLLEASGRSAGPRCLSALLNK